MDNLGSLHRGVAVLNRAKVAKIDRISESLMKCTIGTIVRQAEKSRIN
jgi:hypothetical protein